MICLGRKVVNIQKQLSASCLRLLCDSARVYQWAAMRRGKEGRHRQEGRARLWQARYEYVDPHSSDWSIAWQPDGRLLLMLIHLTSPWMTLNCSSYGLILGLDDELA